MKNVTADKWLNQAPTTPQEWAEAEKSADDRQASMKLVKVENWAGQGESVWCRVAA